MAHNLNKKQDGTYSFVAVGEKAWHGLGTYVNEALTAEQAIQLGGLDYEVAAKKIQVSGSLKVINGYKANVRTDTGDVLGIVTDAYHIVQNREAFGFFDSIVDKGEAIYQTAGALGKGEKIFVTAKLPADILVNNEVVENYLLLTTGHDGKSPIQVGFTSIRVVCNNTLTAALKGLKNRVNILHWGDAKEKLSGAAKTMGLASKYTQELNEVFNQMSKVKITDSKLREFIIEVMNPGKETITEAELSKHFTKTVDSIEAFAHDHSTQQSKEAKGTVWGAYNAISGYFGYIKNYKSASQKMNDIYFNGGAKKIETAFELATQLI